MSVNQQFIELILHHQHFFPKEVARIVCDFIKDIDCNKFICLNTKYNNINNVVINEIGIFKTPEDMINILQGFSEAEIARLLFHQEIYLDEVYYNYAWQTMNDFYFKTDPQVHGDGALRNTNLMIFDEYELEDVSILLQLDIKKSNCRVKLNERKLKILMQKLLNKDVSRIQINEKFIGAYCGLNWQKNLELLKTMAKIIDKELLIKIGRNQYSIKIGQVL